MHPIEYMGRDDAQALSSAATVEEALDMLMSGTDFSDEEELELEGMQATAGFPP